MRILAISDLPSDALWGPMVRERLREVDLILSCGDLDPAYLSYLVTFSSAPLFYVHGNHDARYAKTPPEGCRCIEDALVEYRGLRILGLGGSMRYNMESPYQFTQKQMNWRVRRLAWTLRRSGGFDVLLTHAAARGLGDGTDLAHVGFDAFRTLLDKWRPAYHIHGHTHLNYNYRQKRVGYYNQTQIINAYERYLFELPD